MNRILLNSSQKFVSLLSFFFFLNAHAQNVSTLAGSNQGLADGIGNAAQFSSPVGVAVDASANVYVADFGNNRIRKITPAGVVSTLAGSTQGFANGTATTAKFSGPSGVAVDAAGNVYVADAINNQIRKVTADGVVTTLAGYVMSGSVDGTGTGAWFNHPSGLALDAAGNVFVADSWNHRIRKITPEGIVTTFAGSTFGFSDGIGTAAKFQYPRDLTVDVAGNVYVADTDNNAIRKITAAGVVTTLPGTFNLPRGLSVDVAGNIFIADTYNNRIRKIAIDGSVSTLAGNIQGYADGIGNTAKFNLPFGVVSDNAGNVYVGDTSNHRIRKITTTLDNANYQLETQISIYPNPTSSLLNLTLANITTAEVTIFDMNGRTLQVATLDNHEAIIDLSSFINGIYIIQIRSDKGIIFKKIIKN